MTTPLIEAIARAMAPNTFDGDPIRAAYCRNIAQAALTAITEAGYAVVPVTPDVAMIDAGDEVMMNRYGCSFEPGPVYRAMIQAGSAA